MTSILWTLAAPSRCCIRFRIVSAARSISPAQRGSRARTVSTLPVSVTVADRASRALFEIRHLRIGMVAPDIEGPDQDGIRFKLSDYRGKVVLLDFWSYV